MKVFSTKLRTTAKATSCVLAAALVMVACGGSGGGGGAPAPGNATGIPGGGGGGGGTPTFYPSSIVATPPAAPSYAAGSEDLQTYTRINSERSSCGFGYLQQDTNLDTAVLNHVTWLIVNGVADSHNEVALLSGIPTIGFTGVFPHERTAAAGYPQTDQTRIADDYAGVLGTSNKAGWGELNVRRLLAGPYHLGSLFASFRDIGLAVRSGAASGADITSPPLVASRVLTSLNLGVKTTASPQLMSSTDVLTYPCQGTTGTAYQLTGETPNPVPGRNLQTNPLGGAVLIAVREGNTIDITSAAMVQVSNSAVVTLRPPVTYAGSATTTADPYAPCAAGCFLPHMAYVIPDAPLLPNTQYQVNITGTNNGVPFTRSFTFTTGNISA